MKALVLSALATATVFAMSSPALAYSCKVIWISGIGYRTVCG